MDSPDHIAHVNPFRYRGYYYDAETGFYYIYSRYYDPEVGRFINADTSDLLNVQGDLYDKNLFAYCDANPTVRLDVGGYVWETVFDVASLGVSIAEVAINPSDPWAWAGLAGDVIDLAPFATGIGETVKITSKLSKTDDVIKYAKSIRKSVSKSTGSYEIIFKSGKNYTGKGSFNRAINSAKRLSNLQKDDVFSIFWNRAPNNRVAFIDEYKKMKVRGVNNSNTYNKIWSPGRKYYYNDLNNIFK